MIDLELDRRIPVPLYYQLQQQLRQAILDGRLAAGASLPPEPDLADSAGVSRFTVRQAVEQLVREGLVRRERGRGTFVADLGEGAGGMNGFQFSHTLDRSPDDISIRIVRSGQVTPPDSMQQLLPPAATSSVHEIVRVHDAGGKAVAVESLYLPTTLISDLSALNLTAGRVHPLIEHTFGLRLTHAEETLRAVTVNGEAADLLGLAPGSAAFRIERRSWSGTNLFELATITLPGTLTMSRILESSAQLTAF